MTLISADQNILDKIEIRQAVVAVIGLGYVGLPLAIAFAEAGFRVVGLDLDKKRVASLNAGRSYVSDVPSERLARLVKPLTSLNRNSSVILTNTNGHAPSSAQDEPSGQPEQQPGSLSATTDFNILHDVDAVIICVPTPLDRTKEPDMSYIISAVDEIAQRLHQGMLVVLESTTYPGTTEELVLPRLERPYLQQRHPHDSATANERTSSFVVGRDFFLAFSPERIDPGRTDWTVHNTPKVMGGVTSQCLEVACALYGCVIEHVVPVSLPKTAEMVKLLENTFRAVNIGLINEVAIICDRLGIDVWEVIEAAKTKPFGFMPFYPGPGLGGHCIPIDPQYLAWKLKTLNYNARFIQLAAEINFGMPEYVVDKVMNALNDEGKPLKGSRILILGVAYKADVGDLRESPSLDLIHLLREKKAAVSYHDPYVPQVTVDGTTTNCINLNEKSLRQFDGVVIATAHSSYDWAWIIGHSRLIVDTRNATRDLHVKSGGRIIRL